MRHVFSALILFFSWGAQAALVSNMRQVGEHYPLFLFKKNENRENVMVVYTRLDRACRLRTDANTKQPSFDFYWLMSGRHHKSVHAMIQSGIRERLEFDLKKSDAGLKNYWVKINDMKEMRHDIPNPSLLVRSISQNGECNAEALITLGPSDRGATIRLENIDTEAKKVFLPPFRKPVSITLNGTDIRTGQKISRRYSVE